MTRDELIEAGVRALREAWGRGEDGDEQFATAMLDAVEPLIRADEREAWLLVAAIDKVQMADLRARVEALPGSAGLAADWVLRKHVLALLAGSGE